jgi:gluconate 5-dehydrogenase
VEDLDFVIDLNLRGPYICAREAGKIMKAQGGGKIINISSLMSVLGRATIQPYNATKFAINGLTRGLACELGPYNIQVIVATALFCALPGVSLCRFCFSARASIATPGANVSCPRHAQVNAIGPGYFVTDLTQVLLDRADFNKFVVTRTPAGYWGVPEDLQGAVIFLASPASNYVSGHNLMVDGGMSTSAADSLLPLLPDQQIANGRP